MTEECSWCKHLKRLYVPPVYENMPKDKYVCDCFIEDGEVMYLGETIGHCEVFEASSGMITVLEPKPGETV